jgi:hypothetical protein
VTGKSSEVLRRAHELGHPAAWAPRLYDAGLTGCLLFGLWSAEWTDLLGLLAPVT